MNKNLDAKDLKLLIKNFKLILEIKNKNIRIFNKLTGNIKVYTANIL
jgi:hypothetical protein